MRGLPRILSLFFCNEFNNFDNTGTRMLDSIYRTGKSFDSINHIALRLCQNRIFVVDTSRFCPSFTHSYDGLLCVTFLNL